MAYQGWYHNMGNTRGTWLPGDSRGWRSYKHQEHCDGDYRNPPPPGEHHRKLQRSLAQMQRPPVLLTPPEREIVCLAMAEKLVSLKAEVIDIAVTQMHFHILARFDNVGEWIPLDEAQSRGMAMPRLSAQRELIRTENGVTLIRAVPGLAPGNTLDDHRDPLPRHLVGLAKKHASHTLRQRGCERDGGVFATRCKVQPIENAAHLQRTISYIPEHLTEGGAILSILAPHLVMRHA